MGMSQRVDTKFQSGTWFFIPDSFRSGDIVKDRNGQEGVIMKIDWPPRNIFVRFEKDKAKWVTEDEIEFYFNYDGDE